MKVTIYSCADKRPDIIELQHRSVESFVKDDFEYVILNNGQTLRLRYQIRKICQRLNVRCIDVENRDHSDPCIACAHPLQWAYHKYMKHDEIACIIDSDMFLVSELNIADYLKGYDIAGVQQRRGKIEYLWNGILFMSGDMPGKDELNFMHGVVEGESTDVGGHFWYWLKDYHPRVKNIPSTSHIWPGNNNLQVLPDEIKKDYHEDYRFELYDHFILHYGRGSNWDGYGASYHKDRTKLAQKFVEGAIEGKIKLPKYKYEFTKDRWKKPHDITI